MISLNENGIGGFKEVVVMINGKGAYSKLKYESGVHRVQRVPETEIRRPYPYLHRHGGSYAGGRGVDVHLDMNDCPYRRYARFRKRRPVRQHHRLCGASDPYAHGNRYLQPDGESHSFRTRKRLPPASLQAV